MPDTSRTSPRASALAKLRIDAHLSTLVAAENLAIAEDHLLAIEAGTRDASTSLLAEMARLYHANPHVLVKAYLADRRANG